MGVIAIPHADVTYAQSLAALRLMKSEARRGGGVFHKLKIGGGEPLLNPEITDILRLACKTREIHGVAVMSNWPAGLPIAHPKLAQKRAPVATKWHYPVYVSPVDIGREVRRADFPHCQKQSRCGAAFDAFGFSFCAIAGVLGRILGVNPYKPEPTREMDWDICRHCVETLTWQVAYTLNDEIAAGRMPEYSRTYADGIARHKREGDSIQRFAV